MDYVDKRFAEEFKATGKILSILNRLSVKFTLFFVRCHGIFRVKLLKFKDMNHVNQVWVSATNNQLRNFRSV